MEALAEMPDDAFDLAITDAPYGLDMDTQMAREYSAKYGWKKHNQKGWDKSIPTSSYFHHIQRVTRFQILWGGNYFLSFLESTKCMISWDKMQEFNGATFELAWTNFESPSKTFRMSRVEAYGHTDKIHPTQKPVKLYEWLIQNYAKPGMTILDTHLGSGSIAIACEKMGYSLTGFEIDQEYFDGAVNRFEKHIKQPRIEFPENTQPTVTQLTID